MTKRNSSASGEAEYDDVAIPYADEPLGQATVFPIVQQEERESDRTGVKAEATTKRGGAENNASKYVIVSLDQGDYLPGLVV